MLSCMQHIALVAILIQGIAYQFRDLCLGHLRKLALQHCQRGVVNIDFLLDYHIVDAVPDNPSG